MAKGPCAITIVVSKNKYVFPREFEWVLEKLKESVDEKFFGKIEMDLKNGTIHNLKKTESFVAPV